MISYSQENPGRRSDLEDPAESKKAYRLTERIKSLRPIKLLRQKKARAMTEEERLTSLPSLPFSPVGPLGPSGPAGPGGPGTDFSGWDQRQRQSANGSKIRTNTLGK